MKHWKCTKCQHEWDGERKTCDWCRGAGEVLDDDDQWRRFWGIFEKLK